jgi:hypothetical protein
VFLRAAFRYAAGLGRFLRAPLTYEQARARLAHDLGNRDDSFLRILECGVYDRPRSPYLALLRNARVELGDLVGMVRRDGIEATLANLYDAGVYVTLDEFKGRAPIERSGLRLDVTAEDFDNPLLVAGYEARTSGSRGAGARLLIDLDLLTQEAAYNALYLRAFGLEGRAYALWQPVPPGVAGLKNVFRHVKIAHPVDRWFTQNRMAIGDQPLRYYLFTRYTVLAGGTYGIPRPEHTPAAGALAVASWLDETKRGGRLPMLELTPSNAIRVCAAARAHGIDVSGTFFRLGGEPHSPARAAILEEAGGSATSRYSMGEVGNVTIPCADAVAIDDGHVVSDKLALLVRKVRPRGATATVDGLYFTTVMSSCPRLMINVESGDYASILDRRCSCPFGALGYRNHLHTIRSYDKLTSEGMNFLGSELIRLVEEILPRRFGGYPTDYQLVEEEEAGMPRVSIVRSPRLDQVAASEVVETVLRALAATDDAGRMMAERWRDGGTLRVIDREPYVTSGGKVLALHLLQPVPSRSAREVE